MATKTAPTRSSFRNDLGDQSYVETAGFPNGVLPTKKTVIENMMYLLRPSRAGQGHRSREDAALILAEILEDHWTFCNIYTVTIKVIKRKILALYSEFINLFQTRKKRRNAAFEKRAADFNQEAKHLLDVFCENDRVRKTLEDQFNVKMTPSEWDFLQDRRNERKMYCENFVDKKWAKTIERRKIDTESLRRQKEKAEKESNELFDTQTLSELSEEGESSYSEYEMEPNVSSLTKKRRLDTCFISDPTDCMSKLYQHVREGIRKVRPEIYEAMDSMKSKYHMSENQAEGAVVTVANKVFGRNWKLHDESSDVIDLDTLPHKRNIREVGKAMEVLALKEIVQEIMSSDETTVITYSDDGSKKQGAGSFSVQGVIINEKYMSLPTLPIASETIENLADMKVAVLDLLEAASDVPKKISKNRLRYN